MIDRPKGTELHCFDCAECGHEELGKPVFLTNGGSIIAVGTGCAAKLLGQAVAEVEAKVAAAELARMLVEVPGCDRAWSDFTMCLPQRVTRKFVADTANWRRVEVQVVEQVAGLYKALNRVGAVRRWQELLAA